MGCPYRGSDRRPVPRLLDVVGVCSLIAFGMVWPGAPAVMGSQGETRREQMSLGVFVVIDGPRHVEMS